MYLCIAIRREIADSGCSTVGSAPRSGRGGRKFESSHPDKIKQDGIAIKLCHFFTLRTLGLMLNAHSY